MIAELTPTKLAEYFSGKLTHPYYKETVEDYNEIRIHANGEFPKELIEERRPSEGQEIFDYRQKIWEPITKEDVGKVVTSLSKIRRSSDWSIAFNKENLPAQVTPEESLQTYTTEKYPEWTSLTNWFFSVFLKNYLMDANALVFVFPKKTVIEANEYLEPIATIFNSDQVHEYVAGEYAIIKSKSEKANYSEGNMNLEGTVWYVIDKEYYRKYEQTKSTGEHTMTFEYAHNLGMLPLFKAGGIYKCSKEHYTLMESRISGMIPYLNEAVREYSDMQAEVVQNIFSERWEYASQSCNKCVENGVSTGKIKLPKGKGYVNCDACNGTGTTGSSPYKKTIIRPANTNLGEQPTPTPPGGFFQKDISIAELQDRRIDKHKYRGLAAINMQFLEKTPLAESGIAKEVDRDELNNFVYSITEDVVAAMDKTFYLINELRYTVAVPSQVARVKMLPQIAVPEKFDILSSTFLADEVEKAHTSKLNPIIIGALEVEYAAKKFYNNHEIKNELMCVLSLDPLPYITEDEKMVRLQNGGITMNDYIISSNIVAFVRKAVALDKNFYSKKLEEKQKVMIAYAAEVVKANEAKAGIAVEPDGGGASDSIGKLPLALQQLALAKFRAEESGDVVLADSITKKMNELLKQI